MTTMRVTQNMLAERSIGGIQTTSSRVAMLQEQLSSGRRINRASDSPTDAAQAMRLRSSVSAQDQYARNASDGMSRLGLADTALGTVTTVVNRARDLGLQGANTGAMSQSSRNALATELDQVKASLLDQANTTYLTRPVFGGVTAGTTAYAADGSYVGQDGAVTRRVGDEARVRVDVDGRSVFGEGTSSVFAEIDRLTEALRSGDEAGVQTGLTELKDRLDTVSAVRSQVGVAYQRIEKAQFDITDKKLSLSTSLSDIENIDLPKTMIDLNLAEVAYQTALASAAKTVQPSLIDFLR